jgi:hypothetical protein
MNADDLRDLLRIGAALTVLVLTIYFMFRVE